MEIQKIYGRIYEIRDLKVMIDYDLASLYGIETKVLKQAVRRNIDRFPADFMFELTQDEYNSLRSQIVTLEVGRGKYSKYLPFAFTEQGVAMLASILTSLTAIQVNIAIVRAFVLMRQYALTNKELTTKLNELESRHDKQFEDVYEAINFLLEKEKQKVGKDKRTKIGYKS